MIQNIKGLNTKTFTFCTQLTKTLAMHHGLPFTITLPSMTTFSVATYEDHV